MEISYYISFFIVYINKNYDAKFKLIETQNVNAIKYY